MDKTELMERMKKAAAAQAEKKAAERKAAIEKFKKIVESAKEKKR